MMLLLVSCLRKLQHPVGNVLRAYTVWQSVDHYKNNLYAPLLFQPIGYTVMDERQS